MRTMSRFTTLFLCTSALLCGSACNMLLDLEDTEADVRYRVRVVAAGIEVPVSLSLITADGQTPLFIDVDGAFEFEPSAPLRTGASYAIEFIDQDGSCALSRSAGVVDEDDVEVQLWCNMLSAGSHKYLPTSRLPHTESERIAHTRKEHHADA